MPSHTPPKFWIIIPAAGIGSRMQMDKPKQYILIDNKTILEHTLHCFLDHPAFEEVYVGISAQDVYFEQSGLNLKTSIKTFEGGRERADTVLKGLEFISDKVKVNDWVWVHDAARPCLSKIEIDALIDELERVQSGLVLGVPVADTLKRVNDEYSLETLPTIKETVDRTSLWRAMTPQIFKYSELRRALEFCREHGCAVTDEASALEVIGQPASMVLGSEQNFKVTLPADISKAREYLSKKAGESLLNQEQNSNQEEITLQKHNTHYPRIGTGFDVHAFGAGDFVILGGVSIPYECGLIAHSDGDVLLHAITDALLGALALGDIGKHFPDTDKKWQGANSRDLMKAVSALIQQQGYQVGNVDSTIIAQAPKMAPYIAKMQANIAQDLGVESHCVGVKASTTEKLGFTGRKEGIACQASVLLVPLMTESSL